MKDQELVRKEFRGELCRLFTMLIIFTSTYLLRWISDYFLVPMLVKPKYFNECILKGTVTFCYPFAFLVYYAVSSLVFDTLPILLIVIFHYLAFRSKEELEVVVKGHEKIDDRGVNETYQEKEFGSDGLYRDKDGYLYASKESVVGAVLLCTRIESS